MIQREGEVRIPAGCAISGLISKKGNKINGETIIRSIATMHDLSLIHILELVSQTTDSYVFRNQDGSYSKYVYNVGDAIVRSESPNTNYGSDTYASICSIIGRYHYLLVNFPELAESDFFNDISISINSSYYVMFCNGINNLSGGASAYMYTGCLLYTSRCV